MYLIILIMYYNIIIFNIYFLKNKNDRNLETEGVRFFFRGLACFVSVPQSTRNTKTRGRGLFWPGRPRTARAETKVNRMDEPNR